MSRQSQRKQPTVPPPVGMKHDAGKYRFSLLPTQALWEVIGVLEHGAKKYAADNWKLVDDPFTRYSDALQRHMCSAAEGEVVDTETGCLHYAHVAANALFLAQLAIDRLAGGSPQK